MHSQLISSSYQSRPWRTQLGSAWWLLCQPSPNVNSATHQLLVELSRVSKRRLPQECAAELTNQVPCNSTVVRRKMPQLTKLAARKPPSRTAPHNPRTAESTSNGTICHFSSQQ